MSKTEETAIFPPYVNPLEELAEILARGYLRLLAAREQEKAALSGEAPNNSLHPVELT